MTKRFLDLALGSLLLVAAAPLMAVIAILIVVDSGRPILFTQTRVGRHGRPFRILKFRSMRDGDHVRDRTYTSTSLDEAVFYDPQVPLHVTRVGRVLRLSSLDELPQLWNVVRGDMSLVGPRPVLPGDLVLYGRNAARRHAVRPGMTGLYQVSGRKTLPLRLAIELDLYYVKHHNVLFDLWLLLRTPFALLQIRAAN